MNGKPTMVDNAKGVSYKSFRKYNERFDLALIRNTKPTHNCFYRTLGIAVCPQLFKIILQDIRYGKSLIQGKQLLQPELLFVTQVFLVFQQKVFTTLDNFSTSLMCFLISIFLTLSITLLKAVTT
jgi:hypothetical protein